MAFDDDDDDVTKARQPPEDAQAAAEEDLEDEAQDFRHFATFQRKNVSSQVLRKGEKDFESYGTRSQASALEQSRRAMEDVLSYTRVHKDKDWMRGWYFPDRWASEGDEKVEGDDVKASKIAAERREVHTRERVVCVAVEHQKLGRKIRGQGTDQPGWDQVWLLPEEALFLVERGKMDLWWPTASMGEIFPIKKSTEGKSMETMAEAEEEDEYALGFPLSLQAAYSLLIGHEGERGKVTLLKFQVYSNLNRAGFNVLRVPPSGSAPKTAVTFEPQQPLWQRLFNLLFPEREAVRPAYGPLVRPGLYRSYESIYKQLAVIPRHKPTAHPPANPSHTENSPFRVQYHVWKPSTTNWSKTKPATCPDYHLAMVDAHETTVPTGEEISALLDSVPYAPLPQKEGPQSMHHRLKHGHRNVLVAVVDHGVINYLRFGEGAFGEELHYKRFDSGRGSRGSRGGKRGGGFGKGGRGGFRGGRGGRGGGGGRTASAP